MLKNTILIILEDAALYGEVIGHEIHITRGALVRETKATDRAVRAAIHDLRREGYKIVSSPDRAGYWLGTSREWDAWCDKQRSAALARMYPKTTEYDKQIVISVEVAS